MLALQRLQLGFWIWVGMLLGIPGISRGAAPLSYPAVAFPDSSQWGKHIQRTMRLLATSTAEQRNTVRILFYGQSITEQAWTKDVEQDLRRRFPHANLIVENRALGGFGSQMLIHTAETDLYPFQPDLLIFHVYGAHDKYEQIIRRTRERTAAEILIQTDHVTKPEHLQEETNPAKLPPLGKHWDAFMNHRWLPQVARQYGAELCDQRSLWKAYLTQHGLEPRALLSDNVHLNAHGEWLMAQCVKAYLRYDPSLGPSPAEDWIKTLEIGRDIRWSDGNLRLSFEGSRIDLICRPGEGAPAGIRIDGRKPSEWPQVYTFTRALAHPAGKWRVRWPVVAPIESQHPLLEEEWTLQATQADPEGKRFKFSLRGTRTGPDGEGRSDQRFVSTSGRVVIETNAWNVAYAMSLASIKSVPTEFPVSWKVEPHFVDEFVSPGVKDPAVETAVTVAQGLPNTRHTLEIRSPAEPPIRAIRIYTPSRKVR